MESIQLYLNSLNADKYINNSYSQCEFNLPLIEIPDGFHIYLSVINCQIPYSYYNINSNNNKLVYNFYDASNNLLSTNTITIPNGNYSINSLITSLSSLMTGFTITYNSTINKLTFTHSTNNFLISKSLSTCSYVIGLTSSLTSSNYSLTLNSVVNLISISQVLIHSNLCTYNISKALPNNYCILCSIPTTDYPPYSIINYNNVTKFRTNLFVNQISTIQIKLTDQLGNLLDLNNQYFNLTLQLDVEKFT